MQLFKRVLGNETARRFLCRLGALYIRLAHATGTWTTVRNHIPRRFWDEGKPFILCFWHGRLMMMPYCWDHGANIHTLISHHRDGQIIANTVSHFGIQTIAGSSTRGGAAAMRAMLKVLKAGDYVGITPDGPRGPRMRASDGIIGVARLAGVPIIPAAYGINRRSVLSSWDSFIVAWPFARGVVVWGEPIEIPRDADEGTSDAARLRVEDALNAVTREADDLCGMKPIEPAPVSDEATT